jgi:hypothetical protein
VIRLGWLAWSLLGCLLPHLHTHQSIERFVEFVVHNLVGIDLELAEGRQRQEPTLWLRALAVQLLGVAQKLDGPREQLIREAIEHIGGPEAEALSILLCLKPGTTGMNLETRRQHAAELLGILPDTLRRERHEGLLLWDVAVEVYILATQQLG